MIWRKTYYPRYSTPIVKHLHNAETGMKKEELPLRRVGCPNSVSPETCPLLFVAPLLTDFGGRPSTNGYQVYAV